MLCVFLPACLTRLLKTLLQSIRRLPKSQRLKILYATQVKIKPPTFVIFVNEPEIMHFSYQRYLENKLREAFGFEGTPLQMIIRGKNEEE